MIHPKEFSLFGSFQKHFGLVRCALEELRKCTDGAEASTAFARIQDLERHGDEILRAAIRELDRQSDDFLTPREIVRRQFHQQDRILDALEHLAGRLVAYRVGRLPAPAVQLLAVVDACAGVLENAIRAFGEGQHFVDQIGKMADLENEADQLYIAAIRDLVDREDDPRRLLMLTEIYGMIERIVNLFEDCIQSMEDAAFKALAGW